MVSQADPRAEPNALRHSRRRAEGDERVVGMAVLLGQLSSARKRALATCRNMGVLIKEKRVQTTRFDRRGKIHG